MGAKFCLFPYVRPYINCVQGGGGGRGSKMAKMLRTYYMDAPYIIACLCSSHVNNYYCDTILYYIF